MIIKLLTVPCSTRHTLTAATLLAVVTFTGCNKQSQETAPENKHESNPSLSAMAPTPAETQPPPDTLDLKPALGHVKPQVTETPMVASPETTTEKASLAQNDLSASPTIAAQPAGVTDTPSRIESGETTAPAVASTVVENPDLSQSPSPYLRAAAKSPVKWRPFSPDTFADAQRDSKPVLIDIGANWSHACKVMTDQVYSDKELASYLNDNFVCIKADSDLQPEIEARYSAAYILINRKTADLSLIHI